MTSEEEAAKELALNEAVRRHLGADKVRFETVFGITSKGSLHGVAVSSQPYGEPRKWDKLDTVIYPQRGQGLPELLHDLATMRAEIKEIPEDVTMLRGVAKGAVPGQLIAAEDRIGVVVILDGLFAHALAAIQEQVAARPGGPESRIGFNHFHVTLTVEGELLEEGNDG
jgi:hypothetical protein